MPETKLEGVVFGLIMAVVMVYFMVLYNTMWNSGVSLDTPLYPLWVMWPEVVIAFLVQKIIGGPVSTWILIRCLNGHRESWKKNIWMRGVSTVLVMAPCMTFIVSLMRYGINPVLPLQWGDCLLRNFLFALCLQLFLAGPLTRFTFQRIFRRTAVR